MQFLFEPGVLGFDEAAFSSTLPSVASSSRPAPPSDTSAAAEAILIAGYRLMSPAAKLERVCALSEAIAQLAMSDVRRRHPKASPREQLLRLASRRIDAETMRRAFGWDPDKEGY